MLETLDESGCTCQTFQVDQGLVPLGPPVWGLWPFQAAIQGIHLVVVLSSQLLPNDLEV